MSRKMEDKMTLGMLTTGKLRTKKCRRMEARNTVATSFPARPAQLLLPIESQGLPSQQENAEHKGSRFSFTFPEVWELWPGLKLHP